MAYNEYSLQLLSASSQYAAIANGSQTGLGITSDLSIEAFINPLTFTTTKVIASKYNTSGNQRGYLFWLNSSEALEVILSVDGSATATATCTTALPEITKQTRVGFSYDASAGTVTFYINGVELNTVASMPTSIFNNTAQFAIGVHSAASDLFNGMIDDVRVWNTTRTTQQMLENAFKELVGNEAGLVGYWKLNNNYLDETSNNNDLTASGSPVFTRNVGFNAPLASDWALSVQRNIDPAKIPGSSNLTNFPALVTEANLPTTFFDELQTGEIADSWLLDDPMLKAYYRFVSSGLTTDSSGEAHTLTAISDPAAVSLRFGNGVAFDGNDAYSAVDHADFKPTGVFAVGGWVKTSTTGATQILFQSYSQNTAIAGWRLYITTANVARIISGKNSGTTNNVDGAFATGVTDICDGNIHFVVGIWTGAALQVWVDGKLEGTTAWANAPAYAATNYVRVGCGNNTGTNITFVTGDLTDVFLLNGRALSASEIKSLYQGGADLRVTSDQAGLNEIPFEIVSLDISNETIQLHVKVPTVDYDDPTPAFFWAGNSEVMPYEPSSPFGRENVWKSTYKAVLHLNEKVNTIADGYQDSTSNAKHFTGVSMALPAVSGKFGLAQDFDGTADYLKRSAADISSATSGSFSAWINIDVNNIVQDWLTSGDEATGAYYIVGRVYSNNRIETSERNNDTTTANDSTNTLSTGTWYLVHITSSGSAYKIYLQSASETIITRAGTNSGDWWGDISNRDNFGIGAVIRSTVENFFNGKIQEVRIIDEQLSDDWITAEYNNQNDPGTFWIAGQTFTSEIIDSMGLTDSLSYQKLSLYARSIADSMGITDDIDYRLLQVIYREITDSLGMTDEVTYETVSLILRAIADDMGLTDSISRSLIKPPSVTIKPYFYGIFKTMPKGKIVEIKPKLQQPYRGQESNDS